MICHSAPFLIMTWRSRSCATEVKKISTRVLGSILSARFNTLQDNGNHRIRKTRKVIVLPFAFPLGQNPGGYNFIDGSKEAMGGNGNRDFCAEYSRRLTFP